MLIGWSVAYGTLYAVGSPNVRPTGQHLLAGLRRVGFQPVSAMRAEMPEGPEPSEANDRGRRYHVTLEDGPPLDVTIVDREQQAHGFFYRVWRRPPCAASPRGAACSRCARRWSRRRSSRTRPSRPGRTRRS